MQVRELGLRGSFGRTGDLPAHTHAYAGVAQIRTEDMLSWFPETVRPFPVGFPHTHVCGVGGP